jgi:sorbitol/mannitol transport system permease protein
MSSSSPQSRPRRRRRRIGGVSAVIAWGVALIFFFPIVWMVLTSFKSEQNAQSAAPNLRLDGGLSAFRETAKSLPGTLTFTKALSTSLTVVTLSTMFVLALAIPAAYALAISPVRKWRDVLFFFISTKFLPVAAAILPLYTIFQHLNLIDTRPGLIIVYISINLPLAVWMLRSFFIEFPRELLEAAQLDGAGFFVQLRRVVLPVVKPGIAATALLCFIFAWNEYFLAVNLTVFQAQTIPIWVTTTISTRGQFLAKLSAAATLACLPVIAAGWLAQKRLVRGLTMGALK